MDVGQVQVGSEGSTFEGRGFVEKSRIGVECLNCSFRFYSGRPLRISGGRLVAGEPLFCPECGMEIRNIVWEEPGRNDG
jgi:hypothetical protein